MICATERIGRGSAFVKLTAGFLEAEGESVEEAHGYEGQRPSPCECGRQLLLAAK